MTMFNSYVTNYQRVILVGDWALPLWKMMDFVTWDDYYSQLFMESLIKFYGSSHHQPDIICYSNH